jgi:hypothetical protein
MGGSGAFYRSALVFEGLAEASEDSLHRGSQEVSDIAQTISTRIFRTR